MNLKAWWHQFTDKRILPALEVLRNPCEQYGRCMGCHLCKPPHYLSYGDGAVFPYCVDCHVQLSVVEKIALVDRLMGLHMRDDPHGHTEIAEMFKVVRDEVAGGR